MTKEKMKVASLACLLSGFFSPPFLSDLCVFAVLGFELRASHFPRQRLLSLEPSHWPLFIMVFFSR
jgi:hypothetical protein